MGTHSAVSIRRARLWEVGAGVFALAAGAAAVWAGAWYGGMHGPVTVRTVHIPITYTRTVTQHATPLLGPARTVTVTVPGVTVTHDVPGPTVYVTLPPRTVTVTVTAPAPAPSSS